MFEKPAVLQILPNYQNCTADEDRIAGGYDAQNNKPWIAKVWLLKDQFLCGGTLINKRYLI